MQRSATQILFRYLPGAVFAHEDEFIAVVDHVRGDRVQDLNTRVLLEELERELEQWDPARVGIPNPRQFADQFVFLEPTLVSWDVFPLTFECTNPSCGRVRRWFRQKTLIDDTRSTGRLRCMHCGSRVRQLRYLTAHNCGQMDALHTPKCSNCDSVTDVYLEDLGSFRSSTWKCRQCGGVVQATRFTPCNCGEYAPPGKRPYRTSYTARDRRLWYPQMLTILNLSSQTYDNFQSHPNRGLAAVASWLGDETNLSISVGDLDRVAPASRFSPDEWAEKERIMREAGFDDLTIDLARAQQGPATSGIPATTVDVSPAIIEHASSRQFVERAGLFDRNIIRDRFTLEDLTDSARTDPIALQAVSAANESACELGIEDVSVTQQFPIVLASYGYTRCAREPARAHLMSYANSRQYKGKHPIFAVPASTEALIVTLSARTVVSFLAGEGLWVTPIPADERSARLELLAIMAANPDGGGDDVAGVVRRLVHSLSHALARSLDDGESGFGESSLAEWIVPDALTTAIYVAAYSDFTLGAFETVLRRRVSPWLTRAVGAMDRCDNDPLCAQQRPHSACDRCLHLSFGCRTWNADLDRKLLRRFWRWTRRQSRELAA